MLHAEKGLTVDYHNIMDVVYRMSYTGLNHYTVVYY